MCGVAQCIEAMAWPKSPSSPEGDSQWIVEDAEAVRHRLSGHISDLGIEAGGNLVMALSSRMTGVSQQWRSEKLYVEAVG
jgi:hypothetical protein